MVVVIAPTLFPSKLESGKGVAIYSPKRVLRQLVYDEGIVSISRDTGNSLATLEDERFIKDGKYSILAGQ